MVNTALILLGILICLFMILAIWMLMIMKKEIRRQSVDQATQMDELFHQERHQISQIQARLDGVREQVRSSTASLDHLEDAMSSVASVMAHPKRRGSFGEIQLENIVHSYMGENRNLFQTQYRLDNGKIADGVFFLADSGKVLCIDSKFPADNYLRFEQSHDRNHRKLFVRNMKDHIDAVSSKYIGPQTLSFALLFLPSEAIYHFICAEEEELLEYAYRKRILLTSPTTLVGVLSQLMTTTQAFFQSRNLQKIQATFEEAHRDIARYQEDFSRITQQYRSLGEEIQDLQHGLDRLCSVLEEVCSVSLESPTSPDDSGI